MYSIYWNIKTRRTHPVGVGFRRVPIGSPVPVPALPAPTHPCGFVNPWRTLILTLTLSWTFMKSVQISPWQMSSRQLRRSPDAPGFRGMSGLTSYFGMRNLYFSFCEIQQKPMPGRPNFSVSALRETQTARGGGEIINVLVSARNFETLALMILKPPLESLKSFSDMLSDTNREGEGERETGKSNNNSVLEIEGLNLSLELMDKGSSGCSSEVRS